MQRPKEFVVKHYVSDEHPSLKGMGHDVFVAEDREDVQALADTLNTDLARRDALSSELIALLCRWLRSNANSPFGVTDPEVVERTKTALTSLGVRHDKE